MKEGNVQNYILFEGENDVKSDRFCYDYSNPSPIKKTTKHFTSYKTQMNNDGLFKRASLKQNEFKYDIMGITPKCNDRYIDMVKIKMIKKIDNNDGHNNDDNNDDDNDGHNNGHNNCHNNGHNNDDHLLYDQEHYTYERANMIIHNVIFGKLWVELHGNIIIRNHNNGDFSIVKYIRKGWFEKEIHNVRGVVCDRYKNIIFFIYGKWSQEIYIAYVKDMKKLEYDNYFFNEDGSENIYHYNKNTLNEFINTIDWQLYENNIENLNSICVWKAHKRPHNSEQYYGFNYMTVELNEITKEYDKDKGAAIACTDSRFRPDQRYYENGVYNN
ncbi:hypothetical protein PFFVO_05668 [Plasmodium falciparum Vietnam Oak-Knoll (FVO)]|uniref:Uncharacterized protein n=1 Tax=Plasmodium falciparum Vietnam Oak-Knoll (FVO) TaxID=1036723 RepID=A0A024UYQ4_PLAFA|nr:hypothetical protein PFFVO_05668 [Plasmodium falciparum Vietnam Oak-Knoll (FVO)]